MPEISATDLHRLKQAHAEVTAILRSLGALEHDEPSGRFHVRRMWELLKAVEREGGDVGSDAWARLGVAHGYDARGLGGFFRGAEQKMGQQGVRRVLTMHGRRFLDEWAHEFESDAP